jgi:hypothetical protein
MVPRLLAVVLAVQGPATGLLCGLNIAPEFLPTSTGNQVKTGFPMYPAGTSGTVERIRTHQA